MAYRKTYRRRTYRRKTGRNAAFRRRFKRKIIKSKFNGRTLQPLHFHVRSHTLGQISSVSQNETYGVMSFRLDELPNYTEFTSLYKWFKISAVKVLFIPASNINLADNANVNLLNQTSLQNRIFTAFDYDNLTTPSSMNDLRQYQNMRWSPNNRIHKRFIYPKTIAVVDEDANLASAVGFSQNMKQPWISTASHACKWLGIKYAIHHANLTAGTDLYVVEAKYYLAFKGRK